MTRGGDGILYGGGTPAWKMLGWNLAGVITIMVWTGATMLVAFGSLKAAGLLRVSDNHIIKYVVRTRSYLRNTTANCDSPQLLLVCFAARACWPFARFVARPPTQSPHGIIAAPEL